MNIKINDVQLIEIVISDLKQNLNYFKCMLTKEKPNVFHTDPITDKIMIMKRIDAFNLVLDWYKG